jgi:transposase
LLDHHPPGDSGRFNRAYLLKEALRLVFQLPPDEAPAALDAWIGWARRSRIPIFVKLQRTVVAQKPEILAAIEHGLSNGLIESVNTKIRLIPAWPSGSPHPRH